MTTISNRFDDPFINKGIQSPAQPASTTPASPAAPKEAVESPPKTTEAASPQDTSSVNGSRTYEFSEKDISFGASLGESSKLKSVQAVQSVQTVSLESEDPAALGAAKMLADEGKEAYKAQDYETATLFFEAACEYDAKSPVLAYNLGCCYQQTGNMDKALELFETAKALDPLNLDLKHRIEQKTVP
ncbi:hypothetical protein COW36_12055 [bacterium (Candidatus Blackallbacteria) CG17_big_fil_post_rev_8_21_14_2_50_48_46]|uniref:Uncharacterized protein n=1 Tax=bacterium (Candidatus Blackallbacteria) CG17_big_fil_post_rev_8_21_14_2_50_48_46 TaxID=2014261 RepID=A0A2M7G3Q2_9BACT|nr:MAG: hypothetical protein COW64_03205 [bacterium (Candidatus Blackallbacteria) CG18_big_fil_WC_8_21_14_2_50_49_26]PIW16493.1 MAG: hypothetical protein COW36_12055 [bacterium (Candidatus Blackallbacteria) CG17_big_fil_post_rev_8_21_14_2_50_48_46]PIW46001.1 MAG: hypothetical protein COW20_17320 [bacterium (Candidatus Blackallbacteria) CG13_big_fil_rev_8_21_14_2_50_49_14]